MNGKIRIRHIYKATELKRFHKLEDKYHRMGKAHSGGDTMRVVFEDENGKWLALMVWGSACYHLRPRDEYIGWNMALRRARQKLVVNNRRFAILAKPGEHPNLASRRKRGLPAAGQGEPGDDPQERGERRQSQGTGRH